MMIKTKKQLKDILKYERSLYIDGGFRRELELWILQDSEYLIWHYVKMLRYTEYHFNKGNRLKYLLYQRKKNVEGTRLGFYISHNCFDKGLRLYHYGSVTVNSHARIGKDCKLHGNNCIGNKGESTKFETPIIGDNFEMGYGAVVLGGVCIGNSVTVGANAVVNKSFEDNIVLVGAPAKNVR